MVHKPLWVREHSCPACGFKMDRDANAAINILSRGFGQLGVEHAEGTSPEIGDFWCANEVRSDSSTPVETALAVDTPVSAQRVVETGSPTLKERTVQAVRELGGVVIRLVRLIESQFRKSKIPNSQFLSVRSRSNQYGELRQSDKRNQSTHRLL